MTLPLLLVDTHCIAPSASFQNNNQRTKQQNSKDPSRTRFTCRLRLPMSGSYLYIRIPQKGARYIQRYASTSTRCLLVSSCRLTIQSMASPSFQCMTKLKSSQFRYLSDDNQRGGRDYKRRKGGNPFHQLGIAETSTYAVAKATFLKVAMANHPDTSHVINLEERDKMRDRFIAARSAFEQMVIGPEGDILLKEEAEAMGENFDAWFKQQTGRDAPFSIYLDPQTIKEVVKYTEEHGSTGLDRDGGMWTLANMVTKAAQNGKDAQSILRLESGELKRPNDQVDGVLRRKRRHR